MFNLTGSRIQAHEDYLWNEYEKGFADDYASIEAERNWWRGGWGCRGINDVACEYCEYELEDGTILYIADKENEAGIRVYRLKKDGDKRFCLGMEMFDEDEEIFEAYGITDP